MTEKKNRRKEVAKSFTGIGLGIGLAKLAKSRRGLFGNVLSTASNVMFSLGSFRAANLVTETLVEKFLGKKEPRHRIEVRDLEEEEK